MNLFILGNSLLAFTSGTPMRGLVKSIINQRQQDHFTICISPIGLSTEIRQYLTELEGNGNVSVVYQNQSVRSKNIKNLLGIKSGNNARGYDLYISPGMPEYFGKHQQPSISFIADLSSINLPKQSSLKWHGNRIFKNNLKWCINSNTKVAAISEFTRQELIERDPANKEKYLTIYNGIEDFWFDDVYEETELTQKLCKNSYWVWWGYLSNRKNILRLLQAYLQVRNSGIVLPSIVFIGKAAPDQSSSIDIIQQYPEYFKMYDFQEAYILKTIVKNSKGLLFPSLYEGFGLPVIEAFSQGLPVLHSNVTSLPEVANGLGIEIDPYQIDSIAKGLKTFNNMYDNATTIASRKEWANRFTYQAASLQLSQFITDLTTKDK